MRIIPCRSSISERFPVASFIVEVPSERLFEVVCTTDSALLRADQRHRRTPRNFYTSRSDGLLRAPAGQATWLLPPDQLRRFAGARELFFTLGSYGNPQGEDAHFLSPPESAPSVPISPDFSGRSLDRSRLGGYDDNVPRYGSPEAPLVWGGDLEASDARGREVPDEAAAVDYDDGHDAALWQAQEGGAEADVLEGDGDDGADALAEEDADTEDARAYAEAEALDGAGHAWVKTSGMPGDPLASHGAAKTSNLFLQWNLGVSGEVQELDVVVYCHGHKSMGADDVLQKAKIGPEAGGPPLLEPDFCIADMQRALDLRPGTLFLVPRGKREGAAAYRFPALRGSGLDGFVRWCLDLIARRNGQRPGSVRARRLSLAAHSGGGTEVAKILDGPSARDPDAVFLIDAEPSGAADARVQRWLLRRIVRGGYGDVVLRYVFHKNGAYASAGEAWRRLLTGKGKLDPAAVKAAGFTAPSLPEGVKPNLRSDAAVAPGLYHGTIPIWMLPALLADPRGDVVDAKGAPTWRTAWKKGKGCGPSMGAYRGPEEEEPEALGDDRAEALEDEEVEALDGAGDGFEDAVDLRRSGALDADEEGDGSLGLEDDPAPDGAGRAPEALADDAEESPEALDDDDEATAGAYGAPEQGAPLRDSSWQSDDVEESLELSEALQARRITERDKLRVVAVVAVAESGAALYAAFNDDREFRTPTHPAYQKYHVGASWGVVQFTQRSGNLGKVLKNARARDAAAFARAFGEHAQAVLDVTNAGSEEERVAPVDGSPLWSDRWRRRFDLAAGMPSFQHAQHEVAVKEFVDPNLAFADDMGLVSERALAMVLDRCVHMGNGGGRAWVARSVGPIADKATLDAALRAVGHGTLLSFQRVTPDIPADGRWGARSHAALVAALRALGERAPVKPAPLTAMLDAMVRAAEALPWGRRLARLRETSELSDVQLQVR